MLVNSFFKQLAIIFLVLIIGYYALQSVFPIFSSFQDLFWVSQILFAGICIGSFYGGKYFVKQKNKNVFLQFIMILIFFRLISSASIAIGYFQLFKPISKVFLFPFFVVYLAYSIFEVYFLSKIGREQ